MRMVLQRVKEASVTVDGQVIGQIGQGLLLLLGITHTDTPEITQKMAQKIIKFRVFNDEQGKMNKSVLDISGELLIVSQFTLYGDSKKGNRPSFIDAAHPDLAKPLYEALINELKKSVKTVQSGQFGAHMDVHLLNDGPVTLVIDSDD